MKYILHLLDLCVISSTTHIFICSAGLKNLFFTGDINQEHAESQKATSSKNNSASLGQRRTVLQEEGAREKRKRKRSNSDSLQQKVAKPHESQM